MASADQTSGPTSPVPNPTWHRHEARGRDVTGLRCRSVQELLPKPRMAARATSSSVTTSEGWNSRHPTRRARSPSGRASRRLSRGRLSAWSGRSDINAAREELIGRGVEVSDVFHREGGSLLPGPDPERRSYLSYASFSDPDGNGWLLQEVTTRLPGRDWDD